MFFPDPRQSRGHVWVTLGGTRWVVFVFTIQLRLARDHQRRLADNMYWLPVDMRKTYRKLRDVRYLSIENYRYLSTKTTTINQKMTI